MQQVVEVLLVVKMESLVVIILVMVLVVFLLALEMILMVKMVVLELSSLHTKVHKEQKVEL